jgi:putative zinc finger protein
MASQTHQAQTSACEVYEEDLVLLHYGDLSGTERQKLESHLSICAGCAGYLKELATLLPLTLKSDEPPQEFWQNYSRELRGRLDDVATKKAWWRNLATTFQPGHLPKPFGTRKTILKTTKWRKHCRLRKIWISSLPWIFWTIWICSN